MSKGNSKKGRALPQPASAAITTPQTSPPEQKAAIALTPLPVPSPITIPAPPSASRIDLFFKILMAVIAISAIGIPSYSVWHQHYRGNVPEKFLGITHLGAIDPVSNLSSLRTQTKMALTIDGQEYDNLRYETAYFENIGNAPIVPADYVERLNVTVPEPWKIIAVTNGTGYGPTYGFSVNWKRVSDQKFEAEPALINPGDRFSATAYITKPTAPASSEEPTLSWNTRIINLRALTAMPDPVTKMMSRYNSSFGFGISVNLGGDSLVFFVVAALSFQTVFLHLLYRRNYDKRRFYINAAATTLLSWSVAECLTTYAFGTPYTDLVGVSHFLNLPPIILTLGLMVWWWPRKPKPL